MKYNFSNVDFSRVCVIGSPGSGKSTLSKVLAEKLNLPLTHLDAVLWQPNWVLPSAEQRKQIHDDIISQPMWLIDGMWRSLVADRFSRATVVIYLDYNRFLCLNRAYKRYKKGDHSRSDIAQGCIEKFDSEFFNFIFTFPNRMRPKLYKLEKQNSQITYLNLRSPKQTQDFLSQLTDYLSK